MTTPDPLAQARAILDAAGVQEPEPDHEAMDPWSDSPLSERVAEHLQGRYLCVGGAGWMAWTGIIWRQVPDDTARESVRTHLRALYTEAAGTIAPGDARRSARVLSGSTVDAVLKLVRGQLPADLADFDQDPDILVTPSGVVHLPTGQVHPHDSSRLVTKCTRADYTPGATHADWDAAREAMHVDIQDWMQVRLGQSSTGHPPEDDKVLLLQGGGSNGKSSVLGGVMDALGDYADIVPDSLLLADRSHPSDRMTLRGLRLAGIEELPEGRHLDAATVKKLVGTPTITGHYMRENFVTFSATHSLIVSTNFLPEVSETDDAIWRRLVPVDFPYRYRTPGDPLTGPMDRHGDPGLRTRLRQDTAVQEAVLAWLVAGAQQWYTTGRQMPPLPQQVQAAVSSWRGEQDAVLGYVTERLIPDPEAAIWTTDLRTDLAEWLRSRGQQPWSTTTVTQRLGSHQWAAEHQVTRKKVRRTREEVSRPYDNHDAPLPSGPFWAWVGVRFRTRHDPDN